MNRNPKFRIPLAHFSAILLGIAVSLFATATAAHGGEAAGPGILKELPVPTLAGLGVEHEMIAETDPKARDYDLQRAIDLSFLQQIEASGFIRKLYGGGR